MSVDKKKKKKSKRKIIIISSIIGGCVIVGACSGIAYAIVASEQSKGASKLIVDENDIRSMPALIPFTIADIYSITSEEINDLNYLVALKLIDVLQNNHKNYKHINSLLPSDFNISCNLYEFEDASNDLDITFIIEPSDSSDIFSREEWLFKFQTIINVTSPIIDLSIFQSKYYFKGPDYQLATQVYSLTPDHITSENIDEFCRHKNVLSMIESNIHIVYPDLMLNDTDFDVSFYDPANLDHQLSPGDDLSRAIGFDMLVSAPPSNKMFVGSFVIHNVQLQVTKLTIAFASDTVYGTASISVLCNTIAAVPAATLKDAIAKSSETEDVLRRNIDAQFIKNDDRKIRFINSQIESYISQFEFALTFTNIDLTSEKVVYVTLTPKANSIFTNGCKIIVLATAAQAVTRYTAVTEEYNFSNYTWTHKQAWGSRLGSDITVNIYKMKIQYKIDNVQLRNFINSIYPSDQANDLTINGVYNVFNDVGLNYSTFRIGKGTYGIQGYTHANGKWPWNGWSDNYYPTFDIRGTLNGGLLELSDHKQGTGSLTTYVKAPNNLLNYLILHYNGGYYGGQPPTIASTIYTSNPNNLDLTISTNSQEHTAQTRMTLASRSIVWSDN